MKADISEIQLQYVESLLQNFPHYLILRSCFPKYFDCLLLPSIFGNHNTFNFSFSLQVLEI